MVNLKFEKKRAYNNTEYYTVEIPHKNTNQSVIELKRGYAYDNPIFDENTENIELETAQSFSKRHHTAVVVNASIFNMEKNILYGKDVFHKKIISNNIKSIRYYLGIKKNNELVSYPPSTSIELMKNECEHVLTGFIPIIEDGKKVDKEIIETWKDDSTKTNHPRNVVYQYNDLSLGFFMCNGRFSEQPGLTVDDVYEILSEKRVKFAYFLDGGGSNQLVVNDVLINRVLNEGERKVTDFLYIQEEGNGMKLLWQGNKVLDNTDIVEFGKNVIDCKNGIILCFSAAELDGTESDYNYEYQYIPKTHIELHKGKGIIFSTIYQKDSMSKRSISKYFYLHQDKIIGNAKNVVDENNRCFLREVWEY